MRGAEAEHMYHAMLDSLELRGGAVENAQQTLAPTAGGKYHRPSAQFDLCVAPLGPQHDRLDRSAPAKASDRPADNVFLTALAERRHELSLVEAVVGQHTGRILECRGEATRQVGRREPRERWTSTQEEPAQPRRRQHGPVARQCDTAGA